MAGKEKKCMDCPYRKVFYRGTVENPAFSVTCYWTLKNPMDVKDEECYLFELGKRIIKKAIEVCYDKR